ncbi:tRNA modification GTPase GTPBP3, mitochondrial-like [Octopus sinensis]|uniref:tRNA modification GTPase GTPBP3, mitochondrial-like n=1 Tax=Octopus sinensis TaxID=2607531 RepID=A0A6P7U831_9MOLL|nr:tRNA modification GTPase GTPBP3, mitochondrial-like [Octopus sinensis]
MLISCLLKIGRSIALSPPVAYLHSTIYALASGEGKCAVSVIRISGPQCLTVLQSIAGFSKNPPKHRQVYIRHIKHPKTNQIIDKGLVLYFKGGHPKSIVSALCGTTRDCVEVAFDLAGFSVTLTDTAGIFESGSSEIDGEAVRRSLEM